MACESLYHILRIAYRIKIRICYYMMENRKEKYEQKSLQQ